MIILISSFTDIWNPGVAGGHGEDGDEGEVVGSEVLRGLVSEEGDAHDGVCVCVCVCVCVFVCVCV